MPKRQRKRPPNEGPYGLLDGVDLIPDLQVYADDKPKEFDRVPLQNTVLIPDKVLDNVRADTSRKTQKFADLMLDSLSDAVAIDRAFDFTEQAATSGLRLDLNVSTGITAVIEDLSALNLVVAHLRSLPLPTSVKKYYLKCFIENLAVHSVEQMRTQNKDKSRSDNRMQAYVIRATPKSDQNVGRKRSRK